MVNILDTKRRLFKENDQKLYKRIKLKREEQEIIKKMLWRKGVMTSRYKFSQQGVS